MLDFVTDTMASGRALRVLTMADSYTRECPVIEVNTGISGHQVTRAPFRPLLLFCGVRLL
jgi:putative transposase